MKRQLKVMTLILVAIVLGAASHISKLKSGNNRTFNVTIKQRGELQRKTNNTVVLSPEIFDIIIEFSEPMGILINASFDKNTFMKAKKGKNLDKLPGFLETGMAEELLNPDKDIIISDSAPSYWFYDIEGMNRFNSVNKTDRGIICKRTIQNLYIRDTNTSVKIADINKPVYLVVVSYKTGENTSDRIEVQRQYFKIRWKK